MNIHRFTGGVFQTNGYLLESGGRRILFDAPEGITDWLSEREWAPDAVLFTHLHHDHVIDAAAIQERFECPLWAHSPPDPDLTLQSLFAAIPDFQDFSVDPFSIDRTLAGESTIEIAEQTIDVLWVPGHSPDSLCFLPKIAEEDEPATLFGGDVLFQGGVGRTDFPHGDQALLFAGIREKLYPLPGSTIVSPGHGPNTTIGQERIGNPFVRAE